MSRFAFVYEDPSYEPIYDEDGMMCDEDFDPEDELAEPVNDQN
jgi:hypothetical protein